MCFRALGQKAPSSMQVCMWKSIIVWFALFIPIDTLETILEWSGVCGNAWLLFVPINVLGLIFTKHSRPRKIVRSWLRAIFEAHETTAAAAGIASLMGDCDISVATSQAKDRFRAIDLTKLYQDDFDISLTCKIPSQP